MKKVILIKNGELSPDGEYSQQKIREASEKIMDAIKELWALKHGEQQ